MPRFLIDANLPYRFDLWNSPDYQHVFDLNDAWPDSEVWRYAQEHHLVIVTKDADFSDRIILAEPPPRVIHLRVGNMRMRDFYAFTQRIWPQVVELIAIHKLITVYTHRIQSVT